ncbi:lytic transglycosylase domain-containing protein [Acetobacter sacchari]|uniref:Lytic transglycosylase domain-containing protein n=2 Tax=Acetobacter sacchari TaxID=2661687 RepID=A0ABS3LW76_9PROT|nr:lytic transglycosylase domain-containing protein [Acetobacter sacchari]
MIVGLSHSAHAQITSEDALTQGRRVQACLSAAATNAHVPTGVLLVLLYVEGGRSGTVSDNSNGTVDLGPMQVNSTWIPKVAQHWRSTPQHAYLALRDNVCANIEAGSWILGQAMTETHGDLWQAVAFYHSHTPRFGDDYLRRFYHIATDMMARTQKGRPS